MDAITEKQDLAVLSEPRARIEGMSHPRPKGLLWLYYRIQAGYADRTYGGRLFGPVSQNHVSPWTSG